MQLAENANIGGWIFKNGRLESQEGTTFLDGRKGKVNITGAFESNVDGNRIVIDPKTRTLKMMLDNDVEVLSFNFDYREHFEGLDKFWDSLIKMTRMWNGRINRKTDIRPGSVSLYAYDNTGSNYEASSQFGAGQLDLSSGSLRERMRVAASSGTLSVLMLGLPTSGDYLSSGSLWRDGNTLRIKP